MRILENYGIFYFLDRDMMSNFHTYLFQKLNNTFRFYFAAIGTGITFSAVFQPHFNSETITAMEASDNIPIFWDFWF